MKAFRLSRHSLPDSYEVFMHVAKTHNAHASMVRTPAVELQHIAKSKAIKLAVSDAV